VEKAAVGVVALELDVEGRRVVEGLGGSSQTSLDIIGLGGGVLFDIIKAMFKLLLFPVLGNKDFLLNIAVVVMGAGLRTIGVGTHDGGRKGTKCTRVFSALIRGIFGEKSRLRSKVSWLPWLDYFFVIRIVVDQGSGGVDFCVNNFSFPRLWAPVRFNGPLFRIPPLVHE